MNQYENRSKAELYARANLNSDASNRTEIKDDIIKRYGYSERRAQEMIKAAVDELPKVIPPVKESEDDYTYNTSTDEYVVYLSSASRNMIFPGDLIRAMLKAYSNFAECPNTINEICRKFKIPRKYFVELKEKMGWSHDALPKTNEEFAAKDADGIVTDLIEEKKFTVWQKYQKANWEIVEKDADNWNKFKNNELNPFMNFLRTWEPPKYTAVKATQDKGELTFVVALSDLHFGGYSNQSKSFRKAKWNKDEAEEALIKYSESIKADAEDRLQGFKKCVILSLGDICHTLDGFTDKGTPLKFDCLKEEQFERAFNAIKQFIDSMVNIFGEVDIHSVQGNHASFGDWVIFETMAAYYRMDKRIKFINYKTDHAAFKIDNTLVLMTHGASPEYKAKLPAAGSRRESHVQTLLMHNPEMLVDVKAKIFISADMHHQEMKEYASFEHYMMGTIVGGDSYAEANGWYNRPSQQCLVIDANGIKEVLKYYFD